MSDSVWSARDTRPAEIEGALRRLLVERRAQSRCFVPARALNLVCVVDRQWSGEIANRLRGVGRYHASRTVVCSVEEGRRSIDARAVVASEVAPRPGEFALTRETVIMELGPGHLDHLDTVVDPLLVSDLPTLVWSPHGHPGAVDALLGLAQMVLLDSLDEPDVTEALRRARELSRRVYVVDLAWLRSTPWRERVAAAFDPPERRAELGRISGLAIRHHPASVASALLLAGWLASRLGWRPARLVEAGGALAGRLRARRQEVAVSLAPHAQDVRGLAGVTIETASGRALSLDRGAGGLRARERERDGRARAWTVMGASRGEGGILGEGIRQSLLRDPTYGAALESACGLAT